VPRLELLDLVERPAVVPLCGVAQRPHVLGRIKWRLLFFDSPREQRAQRLQAVVGDGRTLLELVSQAANVTRFH
jgi:hypothetical protein